MDIKPAVYRIFNQLSFVLENLSDKEYINASPSLNGATIGQHLRHTLEVFLCLIHGIEFGKVNYDHRERNVFLESNTLEALAVIATLKKSVESIVENKELVLIQNYNQESNDDVEVDSNVYRELIYNIEHAVHHMALIRVGLRDAKPELKLTEDFGVASSTIRYRKSHQESA